MRVRALVAVLLVLGVAPAGSSAAVRSGAADDPLEHQRPSLDGRVIREVVHAAATYDEDQGTVTVALTYNQPPAYGQPEGTFTLSRCTQGVSPWTGRPQGPSPPELTIDVNAYLPRARLEEFDGSVELTPVIADGSRTVTATVSHPLFAHRDWRCVEASGDADLYSDDDVSFVFAGFGPLPLEAAAASSALEAELQRRYAEDWNASQRRWVHCPDEELFRRSRGAEPYALCLFEFGTSLPGVVLGGAATVEVADLAYKVSLTGTRRYDKALRRCARSRFRDRTFANRVQIVNRRMRASAFVGCDALMAGDVDSDAARRFPRSLRRSYGTFAHGTNTAGFEEAFAFACRVRSRLRGPVRRYALRCRNRLGDGFAYRFDALRKPRPRPRPRLTPPTPAAPSCNPNYGGVCLPLSGDVDCGDIEARDFPVIGGDPYRLDGDGDGIACES